MIKFGKFSVTYPEWVIIGTVERLTKVGLGSFILFLSSVNEWMFSNLKLLFLSMEFGGLVKSNIIAVSVFPELGKCRHPVSSVNECCK